MILGVYWFFYFPTNLYKFDYFKFKNGCDGLAYCAAKLSTKIKCKNHSILVDELKFLLKKHIEGRLFIRIENCHVEIELAAEQLYDYDFLLIMEVEKILRQQNAVLDENFDFKQNKCMQLCYKVKHKQQNFYTRDFFQIIGSEKGKNNSERLSLRMDCNILSKEKDSFVFELVNISRAENINVLFYYEKQFQDRTNLMIFFSNGRQGINLLSKQDVSLSNIENKLKILFQKFDISIGHKGNFDHYPYYGERKIELMIDEDYFIS